MPIHFMIGYSAKSVLNNEFFEANVEFFLEEIIEFHGQLSLIRLFENDT
jgi:hypothetical protein